MPTFSLQGPFLATYLTMLWGHFMAIVYHSAGKAFSGLTKIPLTGHPVSC